MPKSLFPRISMSASEYGRWRHSRAVKQNQGLREDAPPAINLEANMFRHAASKLKPTPPATANKK
jgi:hypothetical protein